MEAARTDDLERLITRADKYPRLKTQMQGHLEVSRRQKDELEEQLKALGSDTSTLKDMAMRLAGRLEPLLSGVTADDMPTHCIAAHSWEQFEIAAYRSMLGAAEELGMSDLQQMCERFIREEQEMANVFSEQSPAITRHILGNTPRPELIEVDRQAHWRARTRGDRPPYPYQPSRRMTAAGRVICHWLRSRGPRRCLPLI